MFLPSSMEKLNPRISTMSHTWRRQHHPKQPTAWNPYPTRIEGYARRSRAASGQDVTSAPMAVGFLRVVVKRAQERRSQLFVAQEQWAEGLASVKGRLITQEWQANSLRGKEYLRESSPLLCSSRNGSIIPSLENLASPGAKHIISELRTPASVSGVH
jgi:hypothetical protein